MNTAVPDGLKDVKGPLGYPDTLFGWIVGLLVLALVIVLFVLWRRWQTRKKRLPSEEADQRTPWELAIDKLNALMAQGYLEKGQFHVFYAALSDILRVYVEDRFFIRAPEMTTEEFLISIKNADALKEQQKNTLKGFLEAADMVKFAKYTPGVDEAKSGYDLAIIFIQETKEEEPHDV